MDQANGKRYFKKLQNKLNPQQKKGKSKQITNKLPSVQTLDSELGLKKLNSRAQHHFHEIKKFTRRQLIMGQHSSVKRKSPPMGKTNERREEESESERADKFLGKCTRFSFIFLVEAQTRGESNAARSKR